MGSALSPLRGRGEVSIERVVRAITQVSRAVNPRNRVTPNARWVSGVPEGAVTYLNAFRLKYFEYDVHTRFLKREFKKHGVRRVIDVGCGTGTHLIRLAKEGFTCTGIDTSAESIALAREAAERANVKVTFRVMEAKDLSSIQSYDAVIMMHVPMSTPELETSISRITSILQPRGLIAYMYLVDDPQGTPTTAQRFDMDIAESEVYRITRVEHWWKNGQVVSWNAFYFVRRPGGKIVLPEAMDFFVDHNDMHVLNTNGLKRRSSLLAQLGYERTNDIPLVGSPSTPPWTQERLAVVQRISGDSK